MTFTLYWLDGKRELVKGRTVAQAMTLAGYSGGAVPALDFWAHGDCKEYEWVEKRWVKMGTEVFD